MRSTEEVGQIFVLGGRLIKLTFHPSRPAIQLSSFTGAPGIFVVECPESSIQFKGLAPQPPNVLVELHRGYFNNV